MEDTALLTLCFNLSLAQLATNVPLDLPDDHRIPGIVQAREPAHAHVIGFDVIIAIISFQLRGVVFDNLRSLALTILKR